MQDVPASPDIGASDDDDDDEDDSENIAWDLEEVDQPVASTSSSSSSSSTPAAPTTRTDYFWKLNPDATPPEPNFPKKLYALLYIPQKVQVGGKRGRDDPDGLYFVEWNLLGRYRQVPNDNNPVNWGKVGLSNRNLAAIGSNGEQSALQLLPIFDSKAFTSPYYIDFFDNVLRQSQPVAKDIDMDKYPYWSKVAVKWTDTMGTYTPGTKETRALKELNGFAFTPKNAGMGVPAANDLYVKLRHTTVKKQNGEGQNLMIYDGSAKGRDIAADGIYVARSTIDLLRTGHYNWATAGYAVSIRTKTGQPTYINCPADQVTSTQGFWTSAYQNGTSKQEGKAVRSRNVNGLTLLFVIPNGHTRVTVADLENLVKRAEKVAVIPIRQKVKIVREEDSAADKKIFNYYVSRLH